MIDTKIKHVNQLIKSLNECYKAAKDVPEHDYDAESNIMLMKIHMLDELKEVIDSLLNDDNVLLTFRIREDKILLTYFKL